MSTIDPQLMNTFRSKMKNPRHFHNVCKILCSKRCQDLNHYGKCCSIIDELSQCLGVPVSPQQRDRHAQWLMNCRVDPQNRNHRRDMWGMVTGRKR
ncbi:hypothetical protein ABC345_19740 [Shouchella sp. 1P09AA]|uniref:hypothetical protein n=1 Tax=unclassified Shouchella TaxID=2893065 RepID=UPI0039A08F9B